MSTPALSTPGPAAAEPAPFDPHDFPADLRAAQQATTDLDAQRQALAATLPWSREPDPGWPEVKESGRERPGRAASPGYTPEQAAEYDRLSTALRNESLAVYTHPWWARCAQEGLKGPDMVEVRQELKRAVASPAPQQ